MEKLYHRITPTMVTTATHRKHTSSVAWLGRLHSRDERSGKGGQAQSWFLRSPVLWSLEEARRGTERLEGREEFEVETEGELN